VAPGAGKPSDRGKLPQVVGIFWRRTPRTWTMPRMLNSPYRMWSRRGLSMVTALALASSSIAVAAPAVVVKNTIARSAPFNVAPEVGALVGGDRVEADETATNGWRRIQLPGGKAGYVLDADLRVEATPVKAPPPKPAPPSVFAPVSEPAPAAPSTPSGAGSTAPVQPLAPAATPGRAPIYAGDFSHLAELVKSDHEVFDLADGLATRHTASSVLIWGGVFGGIALNVLAATAFKKKSCVPDGTVCVESNNSTVQAIGIDLIVLGPLLGWAIRPTRDDKTRVINAWNGNHPDRPFIDRAGIEAP
jgi:uncharacterized protein YgiM (DUF1202 family)